MGMADFQAMELNPGQENAKNQNWSWNAVENYICVNEVELFC